MATEEKVKVVTRVRPLLQRETVKGCKSCVQVLPDRSQILIGKDRRFTFDRVLGPASDQASVFKHCVEPLVDGVFQGYNATVFAYGQTGSGKTFTILGVASAGWEDNNAQGIIPRALGEIFKRVNEIVNVQFGIRVSYLEVYQEELYDLLHITKPSHDIHIRENENGNTILVGIQEVVVQTVDDGLSLLEQGSAARRTGTTKMNERSSRSHTVFTLHLDQRVSHGSEGLDEVQYISAKFHFVDLAGSERAHRTGNEGERFKESVFINGGLLALGNVISALGDPKRKATHIPYRQSRITRILKDSLGGNSKTVMLACLSPSEDSFAETLNSLKYANRARNIRNKPVMNRDPHAVQMEEMQTQIQALKGELQRVHTAASTHSRPSNELTAIEERLQQIEGQLTRSRQHCSDYRLCAARAKQVVDDIVEDGQLAEDQICQLRQWVNLLSDIENDTTGELDSASLYSEGAPLVERLQCELSRCKAELASDEDIFVEKVRELEELKQQLADNKLMMERMTQRMGDLTRRCQELEHEVEAQRHDIVSQTEQIAAHQLLLQQQEQTVLLKERELLEQKEEVHEISKQAQKTKKAVKLKVAGVQTSSSLNESLNGHQQNGMNVFYRPWTAPYTMDPPEAVVQDFRAQSRFLLARLEERDQVQTPVFSDSDSDEDMQSSESRKLGQTVTVRRALQPVARGAVEGETQSDAVDILNMSIVSSRSQLKDTQQKYQEAMMKLRDLQLGIRLKEELIRELVQNSKQTDTVNCQYSEKIKVLEKEVVKAKADVEEMKKKLEEQESSTDSTPAQHLRSEYKQKLLTLQQKVETLQQQQKSSKQMSAIREVSERKLTALEANLGRMKNEQELLKRKLKQTSDGKLKIQHEMQRYQQQVKSLQRKTEQQSLILKQTKQEVAAASRRLRSQSHHRAAETTRQEEKTEVESKLLEKQQWLDSEVETLLRERHTVQALQQDLIKREQLVQEREAMLAEKSALQMKLLRSSQIVSKDVVRLSTHLQTVEANINSKQQELKATADNDSKTASDRVQQTKKALKSLQRERERVTEASKQLELRLTDPRNERRMMALEEAIEALDGMLDYQNQSISERESSMDQGTDDSLSEAPSNYIAGQLTSLLPTDAQHLLAVYFEKVVLLREQSRRRDTMCQELQLTVEENKQTIADLEIAVQETAANAERQITELQKESEQRVHILMQQLSEATASLVQQGQSDDRIQQLEKDLYYYKTTSRELKRRLREASSSCDSHPGVERSINGSGSPSGKPAVRKTRKELRQLSTSEIAARSGGREQPGDQ